MLDRERIAELLITTLPPAMHVQPKTMYLLRELLQDGMGRPTC